MVMKFSGDFAV